MLQFHGSRVKIDWVDVGKLHFGWHCGTLMQAMECGEINFPREFPEKYMYVTEIHPTAWNTLVVKDVFQYGDGFFRDLKREILRQMSGMDYFRVLVSRDEEQLRSLLLGMGIRYLKYENAYEQDRSWSWCVLTEDGLDLEIEEWTFKDLLDALESSFKCGRGSL